MTDRIETQGKTVDEAISEALLQMGARRDEVDVTVLEEPKSGFLGLLGGRPARVVVRKRRSRRGGRRDYRKNPDGHTPHSLDDGRGGRGRGGRRRSAARTTKDEDGPENRGDGRRGRGGRSGRDDRNEQKQQARGGQRQGRRDEKRDGDRQEAGGREGSSRRRGRRGGRRGRGRGAGRQEGAEAGRDRRQQGEGREQRSTDKRDAVPAGRGESRGEGRDRGRLEREGSGRRRGRRGGRRGRGRDAERRPVPEERQDVVAAPVADEAANTPPPVPQQPEERVAIENEAGTTVPKEGKRTERPAAARVDGHRAEARNMGPEEEIVSGISALRYAKPLEGVEEETDETLTKLASGMLVRAGFPCRCEVKPGEYRLVKIVTDDASAGMLIGRHGQTVDAVEHLVERMAHSVEGDRVLMNLDINNYRRRREESLVDRVADAISMVRNTGEDFHMEPMNARERRIVHLESEAAGLHTRTEPGQGGKHVVISLAPMLDDAVDEAAPAVDEEPVTVKDAAETVAGTSTEEAAAEAPVDEPAAEPEAAAPAEEDPEEPRTDA